MKHHLLPAIALITLLFACGEAPTLNTEATAAAETTPAPADRIERGRYLVEITGCNDCHSPKIMGPQGPMPDPARLLSGHPGTADLPPVPVDHAGWAMFNMDLTASVGPWGTSFAANLTSDGSGIGNWTEEQFIRALTKGLYKGIEGSRPLLPPMPWQNYRNMDTEDVKAIFAYLKSTTPVNNVPPVPIPPSAPGKPS